MKNLGVVLCDFEHGLKKYFFNAIKTVICGDCKDTYKEVFENKEQDEEQDVTEYTKRYNSTTRWQTI